MSKPRHHREQIYTSRAIQGRLLVRFAGYFIVYHFVLWHVLFLTQELPIGEAVPFVERYRTFFVGHVLLLACMAAVLPILLWDMLKFSHRIAGPLVRFERALRQMTRGELIEPISLRKGDLTVEFLDVFNEFIAARNRELPSPSGSVAPQDQAPGQNATIVPSHVNDPRTAGSYVHS